MNDYPINFPAELVARALEIADTDGKFPSCNQFVDTTQEHLALSPDLYNERSERINRLCSRLSAPPLHVLLLSSSPGNLVPVLQQIGHKVSVIDVPSARSERQQIQRIEDSEIDHDEFKLLSPGLKYDVVLACDCINTFGTLNLLVKAEQVLNLGGQLLVCDRFVLDDSNVEPEKMPVLSVFLQFAHRIGLNLIDQEQFEFSEAACVESMLRQLHGCSRKSKESSESADFELRSLVQELTDSARKLASGAHVVALLNIQKNIARSTEKSKAEEFGSINSFQASEIGGLFEKCFGSTFDAQVWEWKYGTGQARAICIRRGSDIVSHYGGAPRSILYFGEKQSAMQICDVMVLPEQRSFYSRNGLFFRAASTFLEQYVGNAAEHLLGIGFPNLKAMRIAVRLGLYEKTDDFIEVMYPSAIALEPIQGSEFSQERFETFELSFQDTNNKNLIDSLWQGMRSEFTESIIGVRDWDYFSYRYFQHPQKRYAAHKIFDAEKQEVVGVLITRQFGDDQLIMDILSSTQIIPFVIQSFHRFLSKKGGVGVQMRCWITRSKAHFVQVEGSVLNDLQIEIPCNRWTNGPSTEKLRHAWWLTAGDMDFM